jgi:hypothetical protein
MRRREFMALLGGAVARSRSRRAQHRVEAADDRLLGVGHAFSLDVLDRRFCP